MARKGLAVIAGLLALVFFGSVVCPPVDERGAPPSETVGDADTLDGGGTAGTLQRNGTDIGSGATEESARTEPLVVAVVDDQGTPLSGAFIDLVLQAETPATARAVSRDGEAGFLPPGPGEYLLRGEAEGHLPAAAIPLTLPLAEDAEALRVVLIRGATIAGMLSGVDGKPLVHGEVVFTDSASGEERVVRARGRGAFDSGPLPAAAWVVGWREHVHAEIDPRLLFHCTLGPGDRKRLLYTIEAAGRITQPGRSVGVVEESP